MSKQNNLYNWLFRYNSYQKLWYAARREDSHLLFSKVESKKLLRSKTLKDLFSKVNTNG